MRSLFYLSLPQVCVTASSVCHCLKSAGKALLVTVHCDETGELIDIVWQAASRGSKQRTGKDERIHSSPLLLIHRRPHHSPSGAAAPKRCAHRWVSVCLASGANEILSALSGAVEVR
jgi:hypothetical protein